MRSCFYFSNDVDARQGVTRMPTTLVNLHDKTKRYDVKIDRRSFFGNPYRIGADGDRQQVIEKYRKWFCKRILTDDKFRDRIQSLKDKVLGCWCVPEPCHGMIIIEYLEGIPYENKQTDTKTTDFFG